MKTNVFYSIIIVAAFKCFVCRGNGTEDTTCVVNGFVYEVTETNPLENVTIRYYRYDSLGNNINIDSLYTDTDGKFSVELTKGTYSIFTDIDNYRSYEYYRMLELTDSVYNLDFVVYHPVVSVSNDSLLIYLNPEDPVQRQIVVDNGGTGQLSYACNLYLREQLPEDLTELNLGGVCDEMPWVNYGPPSDTDWKYLVKDRKDQDSAQHDLKSVVMQMIDGTFYLKVEFYDTIRSFSQFNFELWLNSDPAENTGHPDAGFEYLIYINGEQGHIVAPLLDYAYGTYQVLSDPVYQSFNANNDYFIVAYPRLFLCEYEIILGTAHIRPGFEDYSYSDYAPDWGMGDILFTVKSNSSVELDNFWGEADEENADTILLTLQPDIISDTIENFFLAIVSEDYQTPITILPVQLVKPPSTILNNSRSNQSVQLQIHPNPADAEVNIRYEINEHSNIQLLIYNTEGKLIASLFEGVQNEGEYSFYWDGSDDSGNFVGPGNYICILSMNEQKIHKQFVLLR